ncbi:asparaginyl-tRNA synthetase [Bacteroidetes bacterium UKL13-3]|jgi:asparaginyl-tRNA synthetase|nr:asparaginyl-tRNA synthetase [Bacteroidetes bacterium UKL13-3]HCP92780.1 asparagine--tRNA ligase [Bacteroidota bacterium]
MYIKDLSLHEEKEITLQGWAANKRESKGLVFIILRDGTGLCQCVVDANKVSEEIFAHAQKVSLETSLSITGTVVKDDRQVGGYELQATSVTIIGGSVDYPIAKKEHGVEFLMDHRHLWLRSQRQWAIMKIRNRIIYSIHQFFQEEGYIQMDAPLFTANASEGTSTLFETDFYGEPSYLSQSGQLYGEAMAMAMGKIYTFGPTFRAEKSKTRRHLSEFWMIEPEMAFHDIFQNMDVIEAFLRKVVSDVLAECKNELAIIGRDTALLENIVKPFPRLTYDEAVKIIKGEENVNGVNAIESLEEELKKVVARMEEVKAEIAEREEKIKVPGMKKGEIGFNQAKIDKLKQELADLEEDQRNIPGWLNSARNFEYGNDFGGSDETVITRLFDRPIMVYNWPHEVKAFYLKRDPNNSHFARGVDVLAPEGYGEIVGGGERETDLTLLVDKINEHKLPMEAFEWYLDLRRFGSVPHAGFGLGLERLVTWVCKLPHVRESIPFPRMYGRLKP